MTVAELIELLRTKPRDLQVAFYIDGEPCALKASDLKIEEYGEPNRGGWIARPFPGDKTQAYLLFPGD